MDSIRSMANRVGSWVRTNVSGDETIGKDYTPKDRRAREIADNYDKIEDKVDQINKDISKIGDMSELRPPKLSDISDKELIVIGAAGGAAVGGALEMTDGVLRTALNDPKIEITKTQVDINRPTLMGHDSRLIEDKDSGGMLLGYDKSYTPRIEYEKVGSYTMQEGKVVHSVDTSSPVLRGVRGLVTGGIIGGALGVAVTVGRKVMKKGEYEPRQDRELKGETKVIAGATALGAAGGAVMGGLGAMIEAGHGGSKEISFKQPVMEKTVIGQIPQNHYHSVFDVVREDSIPKRDVIVDSPKMERGLLGIGEKPAMETVKQTVEITPRFGFIGQVVGGAVVGAIGGALTGIVANILRKII